jgi:predicted GNAT family N-acyltransferase
MTALASAVMRLRQIMGQQAAAPLGGNDEPLTLSPQHAPDGALYRGNLWQRGQQVVLQQFSNRKLWLQPTSRTTALRLGQTFTLALHCNPFGDCLVRIRVLQPSVGPGTPLVAGMIRPSRRVLTVLSQYALAFGAHNGQQLTPLALRRRHFGIVDATPCIRFSHVHDAGQMAEVKKLRYQVFAEKGLLKPEQQSPNDTVDDRDARSYILLGHFRQQLVATCRAYKMGSEDSYEFDAWAPRSDALPPKDQCVELGRAAIAAPFRNAGLPLTLFRMLTAYTMRSGRRYMVLATDPSLVPFYRCFGFESTSIAFPYPGNARCLSPVLVADLHALWWGTKGNPLIWYALFGSLGEDCAQGFYAPQNARQRLRLGMLRRLGPVSRTVRQWLMLMRRLSRAPGL